MSEEAKKFKVDELLIDCFETVRLIVNQARACYEEYFCATNFCYGDFLEVLVVDGCFIIELFRKDAEVVAKERDDPIFSKSCMVQFLHHDLLLLENQIPWFVLELLFDKTKLPSETKSLIELALSFFANTFSYYSTHINLALFAGQDIKHILDLLRLYLVLPSNEIQMFPNYEWQPIHSATRLKEAGVKFVRSVESGSILDIKFRNGVLEIPPLLIRETTETIFRNLISYEQCLPHCLPVFAGYAMILSNLIDTEDDTQMLCKKEIIESWVSLKDATHFFDKLYYNTYVREFYYAQLSHDLNLYCQNWWPRVRAAYVHNYLSKSWVVVVIAAQLYALSMLLLAFLQTFFTIKK